MNSRLLVLDTCSTLCSVAVGDRSLSFFNTSTQSRRHADEVLSMIDSLLSKAGWQLADIDAIGFVSGPGSFTGLRIGAAVTQGLAFGVDIPAVPVSSLMMQARRVQREHSAPVIVACLIHAREDEFYFGVFNDNGENTPDVIQADCIMSASELLERVPQLHNSHPGLVLAGDAWHHDSLSSISGCCSETLVVTVNPDASDLLDLAIAAYHNGQTVAAELATPVYLKEELIYRTVAEQ